MKAILINQHGAPDVLTPTETAKPEPSANDVLIKLAFASINHLDIWVRKGSPAYPVKLPHILGSDGAGTVEALGTEAEGVSVGDRVLVFPGIHPDPQTPYEILGAKRNGTYAEYVTVPDQNVIPIPDSLSFEEAAAFPLAYVMAWHMLIGRAKLASGESVLIPGAGSGVGVAAIQIAKWKGAKVFAVTTSRHKINKLKSIGADDVFLEEKNSDFSTWALKSTDGRGMDVVVEHVGPATWEMSIKSLAKGGRLTTCGVTSGTSVTLDLRHVFSRELSLFGCRGGTQREFQELSDVVFRGDIKPVIDKIFSLDEVSSAHDYIEGKQQVGKVLLKIS